MPEKINPQIKEQLSPYVNRPEAGLNRAFEKPAEQINNYPDRNAEALRPTGAPVRTGYPQTNNNRSLTAQERQLKEIESILEEDLAEVYFNLTPDQQTVFKQGGEQAAAEINNLLSGVKIKIQQIAEVIRRWLSVLPGVNKFFIEQETKIKTDKLLKKFG